MPPTFDSIEAAKDYIAKQQSQQQSGNNNHNNETSFAQSEY